MDIALTRVGSDRAELARRLALATQIADRDGWRLDSICAQAHWVLKAGRDTLRAVLRVERWGNKLRPGAEQPTDLALEFTAAGPEAIERFRTSTWYVNLQRRLGTGFNERSGPDLISGFRLTLRTTVTSASLSPVFEQAAAMESAVEGRKCPPAKVLRPDESATLTIARAFLGLRTPWTVNGFFLFHEVLKARWRLGCAAILGAREWGAQLFADFKADPRAVRPSRRFRAWFSTVGTSLTAQHYESRPSSSRPRGGQFLRWLRPVRSKTSETALLREVQRVDELLEVAPRRGLLDPIPDADFPRLILPRTVTRTGRGDRYYAVGGRLTPRNVLEALRQGFSPVNSRPPVWWYAPTRWALLLPHRFRAPPELEELAAREMSVTWDSDFRSFLRARAAANRNPKKRSIDDQTVECFSKLNRAGAAHSVEVWKGDKLVGGVCGTVLGSAFIVEGGFEKVRGAWALAIQQLARRDYAWIAFRSAQRRYLSVGAEPVSRSEYLEKVVAAQGSTDRVPGG